MKALMARLDRVQQTSQDAKMAAQSAAASARNAEHEAMNLQKQNARLRDRIKDLESKQKVLAPCPFYSSNYHLLCSLVIVNRISLCLLAFSSSTTAGRLSDSCHIETALLSETKACIPGWSFSGTAEEFGRMKLQSAACGDRKHIM